jgi:hypothetical protein
MASPVQYVSRPNSSLLRESGLSFFNCFSLSVAVGIF